MGRDDFGTYGAAWTPPGYRVDEAGKTVGGYRPQGVSNWGRWGNDDRRGTANLITPEALVRAAGLVRRGATFSLALPIDATAPRWPERAAPKHYFMMSGSDAVAGSPWNAGVPGFVWNDDALDMPLQGSTQWDGLAHVVVQDTMYNGFWAGNVTALTGATALGIEHQRRSFVGRGVLLDVARHRGVDSLEPGTAIPAAELAASAADQGVELEPGDMLLVRTGYLQRWWGLESLDARAEYFMAVPGLARDCLEWLHERDVAAVAADNVSIEVIPHENLDEPPHPLHRHALPDLGLTFGELWDLDELAADCAQDGAYAFLLAAQPLRVTGGVGSPLNPIAIK
jgi:kynurenine formamidase